MKNNHRSLEIGTKLKTEKGETIQILELIGEGSQGWVYKASWRGKAWALKWYKPEAFGKDRSAFRQNLKRNIQNGSPNQSFIWPQAITRERDGTFGYLMELKPRQFISVGQMAVGSEGFHSLKTAVDAALQIVSAFQVLHHKGYCYVDVNGENFTVNPDTGNVLILDNDNVSVNGAKSMVCGTMKFMAPEIVTGKANPSTETDRFSMAVLLYMLFCKNHPFEGKLHLSKGITDAMNMELYGSRASFIMEKGNRKNGPDSRVHINSIQFWKELPDYMKELFLKTFTKEGLSNPRTRPTEMAWLQGLTRFRSEIVSCRCGAEILCEDGKPVRCPSCFRKADVSFRISLPSCRLTAKTDTRIYRSQIGLCRDEEALDPVALVIENPQARGVFGLRNMSRSDWEAADERGNKRTIRPGEVVPLLNGVRIQMENCPVSIEQIR